jgi:hypothetical protein
MGRDQDVVDRHGTAVRRAPREGDFQWDTDRWRRWTAGRWEYAEYSLRPDRLRSPEPFTDDNRLPDDEVRRALSLAVDDEVGSNGASVVLLGTHHAVLSYRPKISHALHALLTIVTSGLWLAVWLYLFFTSRERRTRLDVDPWGNVWSRRLVDA